MPYLLRWYKLLLQLSDVNQDVKSRDLKNALELLCSAGVIHKVIRNPVDTD
jgi:hypothetical protein